jgi:hypothetical protein
MVNASTNISSSTYQIFENSNSKTKALIDSVVTELYQNLHQNSNFVGGCNILQNLRAGYSRPIDPNMAFATQQGIYICPLFTVELEHIPAEIRPLNSNDPRLFDLEFVQRLSDWLAGTFHLVAERVTPMHIAACKTILRLRENPEQFKLAINAGIAHELAHVILKHGEKTGKLADSGKWHLLNPKKWVHFWNKMNVSKQCEREADCFASTSLKKGVEGIEIGFRAWQESLIELRQSPLLGWRDRLLLKLMISPWGNPLPFYFTHGSFDQRIKWAHEDHKS